MKPCTVSARYGTVVASGDLRSLIFCGALLLALLGCENASRAVDPALKPIQEMLAAQLPPGSTEARVTLYLNTQGYPLEPGTKPHTLVAVIRKIDLQRVEPVTARVTFYFDANDKLTYFDLQRMLNQPVQ